MTDTIPSAPARASRRATTDRRLALAIAVVAAIGTALAAYLTYVHYAGIKPICSTGGCETVQTSQYAKLAGIPVAVLGLVSYVVILASLRLPGYGRLFVSWTVAVIGFAFSLYLTYREVFTIKAICPWCVGSAGLLTILAVLTTVRLWKADAP